MKQKNKLIEFIKPDFSFEDERGILKQLVSKGWTQINIVTSVKNTIRGNHYHKKNKEAFYIIEGAFKLILEKDGIKEKYNIKKHDFFVIKPNINHMFEHTENTIFIALYDKGVNENNEKMDIYKMEK